MERTVFAYFNTRREAELAVERLVQGRSIQRTDILVGPRGDDNSAGVEAADADVESGHPGVEKRSRPKLEGAIEISVDCHGNGQDIVLKTLKDAGGKRVHSR